MEKELVEYIVKSLVDRPEEVKVNQVDGEKSTIIEVRVSPDEAGKVIGKMGRIAKSIRTILSAVGTKLGKRVTMQIID